MQCKVCQKHFEGRKDRIFCSIQCKNEYHVTIRAATKEIAYPLDKILHRNRSILLEILGPRISKKVVKRSELVKKKFQFKFLTHYSINKENKMYNHVYDFAWMEFSDDEVLIVRNKTQWLPKSYN